MTSTQEIPWYHAYPAPATPLESVPSVSRDHLLSLLNTPLADRKFILIDLRRADHVGGAIRDSINIPAQSMHHSMPMLYQLFSRAGIEIAVWFCSSSRGRGPRAAAWFGEHIKEQGDTVMQSVVLEGGIKGWVAAGQAYVDHMDGFEAVAWSAEKVEQ